MSLLTFKNSNIQNNAAPNDAQRYYGESRALGFTSGVKSSLSSAISNPLKKDKNSKAKAQPKKQASQSVPQNQIISGYFVQEKELTTFYAAF